MISAVVSLTRFNWLVFVREAKFFLPCEVGNECLYNLNIMLQSVLMTGLDFLMMSMKKLFSDHCYSLYIIIDWRQT